MPILTILLSLAALFSFACGGPVPDEVPLPRDCRDCVVGAVRFEGYHPIPWLGDLWPATRLEDGTLLLAFGDGSGMARCLPVEGLDWPREGPGERLTVFEAYGEAQADFCGVFPCGETDRYPLCPYTRAGLVELHGPPDAPRPCPGPDQCLVSRDLPRGVPGEDVKPSSLLAVGDVIYLHLHTPSARPELGYLALSRDRGRHWQVVSGSPWGEESRFRTLMFLQMGYGYRLNDDGQVYAYGVRNEIDMEHMHLQAVFLARVPKEKVADYGAYRYYAGADAAGAPRWVEREEDAVPLEGLATLIQGSAMYHPGLRRYLFFTGFLDFRPARELGIHDRSGPVEAGALFESPTPWGPWARVGGFPGGYIGALIPQEDGSAAVRFTAAGGTVSYNLNIGTLQLETGSP
ncbi:MAG: DUF4185 domain-containing protein [Gammaproteobacteria bacterium]|nr:MAG: DUF4185 domain-containing protein [Gammaproteobacteria bacterium]